MRDLAGQPTVPDSWLGRAVTLESDWARFTEGDLNEASNRLFRYAELYRVRLAGLTAAELDRPRPSAWTVRQIAHHVAGVTYYAHQVGDLTVRQSDRGAAGRPAAPDSVLLSERTGTGPWSQPGARACGRLLLLSGATCACEADGSLDTSGCIQRSIGSRRARERRAGDAEARVRSK